MKLKNKLLPLVGVGAACAAVTPIALTSCKGSDFIDCTNLYNPSIKSFEPKKGEESWTLKTAYSAYFNDVCSNPEIFKQDMYWSSSAVTRYINVEGWSDQVTPYSGALTAPLQKNDSSFEASVTKDNELISNLSFKEFEVGEEKQKIWTVSFERQLQWHLDMDFVEDGGLHAFNAVAKSGNQTQSSSNINATIKYVNVPIVIYYDNESKLWYTATNLVPLNALWEDDEEASFELKADVTSAVDLTKNAYTEHSDLDFHYDFKVASASDLEAYNAMKVLNAWFAMEGISYNTTFNTVLFNTVEYFSYSHYLYNITFDDGK